MKITNKIILVTGANRGIGEALVTEALRRGASKVVAGTRGPFRHPDPRVVPLTLDVTSDSQIERAARELEGLDLLVNNAGLALHDDLGDLDALQRQLAVNFLGPLKTSRALLPLLTRSDGAILNILSLAALAPVPLVPGYSASKAAALSLTQSLRMSLAGRGVSVHAAFLGPIDTEMARGIDVPKASPESAAIGILDGLESGEEDIFPDPVSAQVAEGFRMGVAKTLERSFSALVPPPKADRSPA
jgi:NAD(P)-dependent dehydrogenase (short-subunit alcohol dehydrogenase family)